MISMRPEDGKSMYTGMQKGGDVEGEQQEGMKLGIQKKKLRLFTDGTWALHVQQSGGRDCNVKQCGGNGQGVKNLGR